MDIATGGTCIVAKRRAGGAKRWDVSAKAAGACATRFDVETDRVDAGTKAVYEDAMDLSARSEGVSAGSEGADAVPKERRRRPDLAFWIRGAS
jgi:hypothetical protein